MNKATLVWFCAAMTIFVTGFSSKVVSQDFSDEAATGIKSVILNAAGQSAAHYYSYLADQFDLLSRGESSIFGRANSIKDTASRIEIQSAASRKSNELARKSYLASRSELSIKSLGRILNIVGLVSETATNDFGLGIELDAFIEKYPELDINPSIMEGLADSAKTTFFDFVSFGGVGGTALEDHDPIPTTGERDKQRWLKVFDSVWFDIVSDPSNPLYAELVNDYGSGQGKIPIGLLQYLKIYRKSDMSLMSDMGFDPRDSRHAWIDNWVVNFTVKNGRFAPNAEFVPTSSIDRKYSHLVFSPEQTVFSREASIQPSGITGQVYYANDDLVNELAVALANERISRPTNDTVFLLDRNYHCVGTGCNYSNILQDSVYGQWYIGNPVISEPIEGDFFAEGSTFKTLTGSTPTVTAASFGDYSYTAWGIWTTNDHQTHYGVKSRLFTEYWLAGGATHPDSLPRVGSASYSGEIIGTLAATRFQYGAEIRITGDIEFEADFASQSISGAYQFPTWKSGQIPEVSIDPTNGNARFSGSMQHTTGGTGSIQGVFIGPYGEEIGGIWQDGLTGGIFRAK